MTANLTATGSETGRKQSPRLLGGYTLVGHQGAGAGELGVDYRTITRWRKGLRSPANAVGVLAVLTSFTRPAIQENERETTKRRRLRESPGSDSVGTRGAPHTPVHALQLQRPLYLEPEHNSPNKRGRFLGHLLPWGSEYRAPCTPPNEQGFPGCTVFLIDSSNRRTARHLTELCHNTGNF